MQVQLGRSVKMDRLEEPDEFLVATRRRAVPDDLYVKSNKGGEQSCRVVPILVVCQCAATSPLHGQV